MKTAWIGSLCVFSSWFVSFYVDSFEALVKHVLFLFYCWYLHVLLSCEQNNRLDIIKPVALTHPPPQHHTYSSAPSTLHYNKAPRPYGGYGTEHESPLSQPPFALFIPSPSSAFTPSASYTRPPLPPAQPLPPPVSYPSSSSPPVLVPPRPSVYNTPIHLYFTEYTGEVAMGQRRGLLESQGGAQPLQLNGWVAPPSQNTSRSFYF